MNPSLEEIASEVNVNQEKGIFYIPEAIKERRVIRYFLEYSKKQKEHPIVILEEKYTRQSVMNKLGKNRNYNSNRNLVISLLEYWLLRTPSNEKPDYPRALIDNLSLAQIISFAYQVPIENILSSKSYFSSSKFKSKSPEERVKILFNAYTGTSWFERFRRKYKRRKSNQRFTPWHNISLTDLPKILCTSDYEPHNPDGNLTKLVNAGLIIPRTRFRRFYSRNFVNVRALIELASLTTGKPERKLTHEDTYIDYITRKFIRERLIPYLNRTHLEMDSEITLEEARYRTGLDSDILCRVLRIKPNKSKRFYSKITKIKALDLALYELKNTHRRVFEEKNIRELFGMENIDLERCNLFPNANRTYARHQKVFPFYDSVGEIVKRMLLKDPSESEYPMPVRINGDTYNITQKTIESYTKVYGLKEFDQDCMRHLMQCLMSGTRNNRKIISRNLIFNLKGKEVSSVKINCTGYKAPVPKEIIS